MISSTRLQLITAPLWSHRIYQSFLRILIFSCLLSGCSSSHRSAGEEFRDSTLQTADLIRQYGIYQSAPADQFLSYLTARITLNDPDRRPYRIVLLKTHLPLAYSPGGGRILISRGIIAATQTEAELAFILAHEIAHQALAHTSIPISAYSEAGLEPVFREVEFEADNRALGLVGLAGYDPRSAARALMNVYRAGGVARSSNTHPELEERVQTIFDLIDDSRWRPPGTVNRREFVKFRKGVIAGRG